MLKGGDRKLHVEQRSTNRVSSAVWPVKTRKGVATGKAAQRRRDWIIHGCWWIVLIDALSMRILLVLVTLLVVTTSLLVALLGLHFWYLLPLPLLLFAFLLLAPRFLASRRPVEIMPSSPFGQKWKSSAGILSQYAQEIRSEPGLLAADVEAPATPMPVDPPLVRVLETYDLRQEM